MSILTQKTSSPFSVSNSYVLKQKMLAQKAENSYKTARDKVSRSIAKRFMSITKSRELFDKFGASAFSLTNKDKVFDHTLCSGNMEYHCTLVTEHFYGVTFHMKRPDPNAEDYQRSIDSLAWAVINSTQGKFLVKLEFDPEKGLTSSEGLYQSYIRYGNRTFNVSDKLCKRFTERYQLKHLTLIDLVKVFMVDAGFDISDMKFGTFDHTLLTDEQINRISNRLTGNLFGSMCDYTSVSELAPLLGVLQDVDASPAKRKR